MNETDLDEVIQAQLLYEWKCGRIVPIKEVLMKNAAARANEGSYHLEAIARHLATGKRRTLINMAVSPSFTLDMKPLDPGIMGGPVKLAAVEEPCLACRGFASSPELGDNLGFKRLHVEIATSLRPLLRAIRDRIAPSVERPYQIAWSGYLIGFGQTIPKVISRHQPAVQNFLVDKPSKAHGWRKPCPACDGWGIAKPL